VTDNTNPAGAADPRREKIIPLSPKERMAIGRHPMPSQAPEERCANFNEVPYGYDEETAQLEARRCLECPSAPCVSGCPVGIDIPRFVARVAIADYAEAARVLKEASSLAAVCGRVCPQEEQCEAGKRGQPVAIGRLERFVGDFAIREAVGTPVAAAPTGRKVAVVGSGPAGLTCAVDLAKLGHKVTIFESLHLPGGVLIYGIPEFRLPKSIINSEIRTAVEFLGIELLTDHVIGNTYTLDELLEEYDAVFLGTGAGLPSFMRIPGINLNGVMSANEFLTRVNLMKGYKFPDYDTPVKTGRHVAVIGAGNVAMDSARSAKRLQMLYGPADGNGSQHSDVHVVYRRSRAEVPAREEEFHHAVEEGVIFDFLTNPVEILGDEKGNVTGMRCIRMELGEPDASGRRSPVPIEGSEFEMVVDTVIFALGTSPNPIVFTGAKGLERSRHGTVVADPETGRTKLAGVWAGGDVVTGAATVISAMGAGKRAAADMHKFLVDPAYDVG